MSYIPAKAEIMGCKIDIVNNNQALEIIEDIIREGKPGQVITLNAEIVYQARENRPLRELINRARLVTPDGIGIVWGGRQLGYHFPERVTGIDLVAAVCNRAAERCWKVYLLGAAPGVADKAAQELQKRFPGLNICGTQHGYFQPEENQRIVENIKAAEPAILFVALGAPKQEFWIDSLKEEMQVPLSIGVGGSFDVIAGLKKRAPAFFIRLNLEWLYRLVGEPSRWKRQLALPRFAISILRARLGGSSSKSKAY